MLFRMKKVDSYNNINRHFIKDIKSSAVTQLEYMSYKVMCNNIKEFNFGIIKNFLECIYKIMNISLQNFLFLIILVQKTLI